MKSKRKVVRVIAAMFLMCFFMQSFSHIVYAYEEDYEYDDDYDEDEEFVYDNNVVENQSSKKITFDVEQLILYTGVRDSYTLKTYVDGVLTDNSLFDWYSTWPEDITVDQNGVVRSVSGKGSALISATMGNYEGRIYVYVKQPKISIEIAQKEMCDSEYSSLNVPLYLHPEGGDTAEIIAKINGESVAANSFEWNSSDPSVAVVQSSEGKVQAVGVGSCIISAAYNNEKYYWEVVVNENADSFVQLKKNKDVLYLYAGDSDTVGTLFKGMKDISSKAKWTSSNSKVATVNGEGTVYAKKQGKCVITATYKGKKYKADVVVKKTVFELKNKNISLKYGGSKLLKFRNKTDNRKYTDDFWDRYIISTTTSDKYVAEYDYDDCKIKAKGPGKCKISFTFVNGQKLNCIVTVGNPSLEQEIKEGKCYAAFALDRTNTNIWGVTTLEGLYFKNNSSKKIVSVDFGIITYNNKGEKLESKYYNYDHDIYSKSTADASVVVSSSARKWRACVKKVYYVDGTTWTNPVFSKWEKKYKYYYKGSV